MSPLLEPGDRVLVDRREYRQRPPEPGEVVVLRDPEGLVPYLIKRVVSVTPGAESGPTVEVRGVSEAASRDSRRFGPVPVETLLGPVYFRYWPASRRGPLPRPAEPPPPGPRARGREPG
jgi:signal peptidase I